MCLTLCDPLDYSLPVSSVHGDSPGKNTGVAFLLQGVFPTQGSNLGLPHCRWILYCLSHPGKPKYICYHLWDREVVRTSGREQGAPLNALWWPQWKGNPTERDGCVRGADSLCHTAETNKTVKQLHTMKINLKKKQREEKHIQNKKGMSRWLRKWTAQGKGRGVWE